jgi:hypothetical protein
LAVSDLPSKSGEVQEFVAMLNSTLEQNGSYPEVTELEHPFAAQLPLMPESLPELAKDIEENRLLTPMVLHKFDNKLKILEGRRRYSACKLLKTRPFTTEDFSLYDESRSGDPELYAISVNIMRRQLPDDVRRILAAEHWQRIKQKAGQKAGQDAAQYLQTVGTEEEKRDGKPVTFPKTPAQRKQESREREEQVAKAYQMTVNAMEEGTRLLKADPEKAQEVKVGKTTFRKATQEVAKKTGWQTSEETERFQATPRRLYPGPSLSHDVG